MGIIFVFVVLLQQPFQPGGWNGDEMFASVFVYMCYFILCLYSVRGSSNVFLWVAF